MKRSIAILALSGMIVSAWAELEYKGLDLGKDDSLLFSTQTELPGDGAYDTLFASDLNGAGTAQLTVFPEQVCLVEGGSRLQVQNRFGLFRSGRSLSGLVPVAGYPAFARGSSVRQGRLVAGGASFDLTGRYEGYGATSPFKLKLSLHGLSLPLEPELVEFLGPQYEDLQKQLAPAGRADLTATVERRPDAPITVSAEADIKGMDIKIPDWPARLQNVKGKVELAGQTLRFKEMTASLGPTTATGRPFSMITVGENSSS